MAREHVKSTLAAMASRNTKAANRAKAAMKAFRTAVTKILVEAEEEDALKSKSEIIAGAIKDRKSDATRILTNLHEYYEELSSMNESTALYDSLLKELMEYLDKLDALQSRMSQGTVEIPVPESARDTDHEPSTAACGSLQVEQETLPVRFTHPVESRMIEERSQQIQQLRSNIYDIQDLYVQIGDVVEYQGDQLDNIESNMAHAFEDTLETNIALNHTAERRRSSWWPNYALYILAFALVVIVLLYRKM
ncbi:hypothetical protein, conserved [Babesia bigemina]|uniref:t-SNARE coiled-coil homology domain-containing protein n=1 Tax=Babesia bigemina TaxID=5866 RepID=A0A061CZI1_BABBI|nr:hypothetical protein, conserved [Babesia bigemina]CDR94036.1 hypothetical protein, conserved [Babesia bigemina]|eukprot:XP_012766222.1 hypothetical protein, conserved [Babesia bigemina]